MTNQDHVGRLGPAEPTRAPQDESAVRSRIRGAEQGLAERKRVQTRFSPLLLQGVIQIGMIFPFMFPPSCSARVNRVHSQCQFSVSVQSCRLPLNTFHVV